MGALSGIAGQLFKLGHTLGVTCWNLASPLDLVRSCPMGVNQNPAGSEGHLPSKVAKAQRIKQPGQLCWGFEIPRPSMPCNKAGNILKGMSSMSSFKTKTRELTLSSLLDIINLGSRSTQILAIGFLFLVVSSNGGIRFFVSYVKFFL